MSRSGFDFEPHEAARRRWARRVLRVTVALLLIIHGVARTALGIVDDFGVFLTGSGLPFGPTVAWVLTVVEIAGGLALAAGALVGPLCLWFAVELAMGIVLVHAPNGWFVVGAGRNGVEFSVLLIVCLAVIALEHSGRRWTGTPGDAGALPPTPSPRTSSAPTRRPPPAAP